MNDLREAWVVLMSNGREVSERVPLVHGLDEDVPVSFARIEQGVTVTHLRSIDAEGNATDLSV